MLVLYALSSLSMTRSSHVFKEHALLSMRSDVQKVNRAQPLAKHTVVFAISQRNIPELERILLDVSDPTSENYGKHLTRAEVGAFTSNPTATEAVLEYLLTVKEVTIDHRTLYDEYITATGPVEVWEALLNTEFNVYALKEAHFGVDSAESDVGHMKSRVFVRSESYSLPSELSEHVTAVFNTVQFPELRRKRRSVTVSKAKKAVESVLSDTTQSGIMSGYVTPQLLYQYYTISNPVGSANVSQAVFASLNDALNPDDLTLFQQTFSLRVEAISQDIGGHVSTQACNTLFYDGCVESNLDVQYIMAVSQSTPTTYYYYDFISWSDWITTVADTANPANVYSISWASLEILVASSVKESFQTEAIKLGIMGTTLVAASGDDGVTLFGYFCGYFALFPASCPYVTAVGGTSGPESNNPEIACTSNVNESNFDESIWITSGGGFSSYYDAPDFQKPFINTYFSSVDGTSKEPSYSSGYNPSKRGYPDVALMAHNYMIAVDGELVPVDGTSASSPVFAGMLSLINSQLVEAGKSTLGWVNPLLYKYYAFFTNDITLGDKNGCSSLRYSFEYDDDYYGTDDDNDDYSYSLSSKCCDEGFYPTTGWDPITGLGSINLEKFSALVNSTFNSTFTPTFSPTFTPTFTPTLTPTFTPTLTPTAAPVASPSKSLTTGAIVGITFACIAEVCLLVFAISYFLRQQRSSGPSASAGTMALVSTIELAEKNDV